MRSWSSPPLRTMSMTTTGLIVHSQPSPRPRQGYLHLGTEMIKPWGRCSWLLFKVQFTYVTFRFFCLVLVHLAQANSGNKKQKISCQQPQKLESKSLASFPKRDVVNISVSKFYIKVAFARDQDHIIEGKISWQPRHFPKIDRSDFAGCAWLCHGAWVLFSMDHRLDCRTWLMQSLPTLLL